MKIYELTAHELGDMYRKKQISVVEATGEMLKRISDIDPKVESYLSVCVDDAMKDAQMAQEKFDRGEDISPLTGIPAAIKDNICTKGLRTTCASKILENFVPPYDATVMKRLKKSDTVVLGKTNLDEFAMGGSTENSSFKVTRNPWDLSRVPGGSSGGSAASVASSTSIFALGSDTGGSVRQPAALCGVVGLKPTYGSVSRYGLVAFASSLDQIGPITKDVEDAALVMNVISGHDAMDSTSVNNAKEDYTKALVNDVKGMKIGLPSEYFADGLDDEIKESVLNAVEVLESLGATVGECSLPMTKYAIPAYYVLATSEASSNLARFDGVKYGFRAEKFEDLADMYRETRSEGFGKEVKRRIMLGTYALSSGYYDAYYKKALQVRTLIKQGFDSAFEKFDVVIGPTTPSPAFKIGEKINDPVTMYLEDIFTVPANIGGIPGMSVPCGFNKSGLPIGMQIMSKPFSESTLLQVGYTFQQNTDYHKKRAEI